MSVVDRVIAAADVYKKGEVSKAIDLFEQVMAEHEEELIALKKRGPDLRLFHRQMGKVSALRQALVQLSSGSDTIEIDVSAYFGRHPFRIKVNKEISRFASSWKMTTAFDVHLASAIKHFGADFKSIFGSTTWREDIAGSVYVSAWMVTDAFEMAAALPDSPKHVINIGCGMGFFDAIYLGGRSEPASATLIDIDETVQQSVSEVLTLNGIENATFQMNADNIPYDKVELVYTVRSCGYLYEIDTYDDVFRALKPGCRCLIDVTHERREAVVKYFEGLGTRHNVFKRSADETVLLAFDFV